MSKSHPLFGRIRYGAPPLIRKRQWNYRQHWISEVHKLSLENFFEDEKISDTVKIDETNVQDGKGILKNIVKKFLR